MASAHHRSGGARSKRGPVSSPPGSVGDSDAPDKLISQLGFTEDFDPGANIDKEKQNKTSRKRRKIQATATDPAQDATGAEGAREKRQVARPARHGKYVPGRRGHLKLMTEIPIDTLHEIFRQLDPADLLALSWSSKNLRFLIMEKSARYIWQEAFKRVYASSTPPPRCPEDLNLAQYARFLFNKKCMVCEVGNGHWTSWMMRLRACSKCLESDRFALCNSLLRRDFLSISTKKATYCLRSDIEDLDAKNTEDVRNRRLLKETRIMGELCFRTWEKGRVQNREAELGVIRLERRKAILEKLEELGWKESDIKEMYFGQIPFDLPGLGRAKKLTNKDWQDLEPKLLQRLALLKEDYLARQKHSRMENRWRAFESKFESWAAKQSMESSMMPRVADIAVLEPFRTTIFATDTETADFEIDTIDQIAKSWITERNETIFSLLPKSLQDRYQADQLPSLRSHVILRFRGHTRFVVLDEVYDYRDIMWRCSPADPGDCEIRDMLTENAWEFEDLSAPWAWTNKHLCFDEPAFKVVKDVLEFLGLNPYTTMLGDLELHERSYRCLDCPRPWLFAHHSWYSGIDMIEHDISSHVGLNWTSAYTRWSEDDSDYDSDSDLPYVTVAELMGLL